MKKMLILLLFFSGAALAQKLPDNGFDKIRIAMADKTVQAELKSVDSDPDVEQDRFYYWYSSNIIHSTQGGFSGRLLNGLYSEYHLNKNLKAQGMFKKGLKDGTWRSWNENGSITEAYTWKKGIKSGTFSIFDEHGIKQSGTYHHNQIDGKVKNYSANGLVTIAVYRHGVMVANKTSPSFWDKLNIFKRKIKPVSAKPTPQNKI